MLTHNKATLAKILTDIDRATEPKQMTLGSALEFLEQLSTEIGTRIDGIKDDMTSRGQDWSNE